MRLVRCEDLDILHEVRLRKYRTKLDAVLREFIKSGYAAMEAHLEENEYVNTNSCANALRKAIKNGKYPIWVITKNGRVYLVRNDI